MSVLPWASNVFHANLRLCQWRHHFCVSYLSYIWGSFKFGLRILFGYGDDLERKLSQSHIQVTSNESAVFSFMKLAQKSV
jgi:hypothetical protein